MPARTKATGRLAGLVGSDSEPDLDILSSAEQGAARDSSRAMPTTKKPRGRPPAANKVTKPAPKTAARRSSGRPVTATQSSARQALVDKSNTNATRAPNRTGKGSADEDEMDVLDQPEGPPRAKTGRGRPKATEAKSARAKREQPEEIPETQQAEPMEVDEEEESVDVAEPPAIIPDTDTRELEYEYETSDVALRRRLGELTRKYESLESRHRDLREVGVKEAERNFDRLRKQAEENTAASTKLIAQLKEELKIQSGLARQGDEVREELEGSEARAEDLEGQVAQLHKSLNQARVEIKTLSTKLAAARDAEASMVPGSALKPNSASNRGAPSSELMQAARAKEDLYGDLTGLMVRGVKRGDAEDIFDCIQTGRNGTLHFKLAVETVEAADSYEGVQFTYRPQLDEDRDGDLMDMLPDYLVEEITFPRPHASKFYARVVKSLTERLD